MAYHGRDAPETVDNNWGWGHMTDYREDPDYRAWEGHVREKLIPMIDDSAATISVVPGGETDIKFAVELGLSIMMNKPIIALVERGSRIPDALARVADEIVEVDLKGNPVGAQKSITAAFERVMRSRMGHVSLDDDGGEVDD